MPRYVLPLLLMLLAFACIFCAVAWHLWPMLFLAMFCALIAFFVMTVEDAQL
jgi:hypothetical protein